MSNTALMRFYGPEIEADPVEDHDRVFWGWLPENSRPETDVHFQNVLSWLRDQVLKGSWYWSEGSIRETSDKGYIVQVLVFFVEPNDALVFKMAWAGAQVPSAI